MTATKNFLVDSFVVGKAVKAPCRAVAILDITLSAEQTVNGVAVVDKDRVLVTSQTDPIENGIYDVSSSAWTRSADWDGNRDVANGTMALIAIENTLKSLIYQVITSDPIVIGTTAVSLRRIDVPGFDTIGDKDVTLTARVDEEIQQYTGVLTTNRTVTLSTVNAIRADRFRIVRTGLGAFTLDVGGLKTVPNSTAAFVDVEYNGVAWVLTGYGEL